MHIGQGGAYFHVKKDNLTWAFFYADDPLLVENVVRCHHDPLWFVPESVMRVLKKQFVPLVEEEEDNAEKPVLSQQVLDQTVRDMMGFADDLDTAPAEEEKKTGKETSSTDSRRKGKSIYPAFYPPGKAERISVR